MIEAIAISPFGRIALLVGVFALVAILVFLISSVVMRRMATQRGLEAITAKQTAARSTSGLRTQHTESAWAKLAATIEKSGLHLADSQDSRLRAQLKEAGYSSPSAPRNYTLVRLILVFELPGVFVL